jgi:tRNA dimethylallyltransferase
MKKFSLDWKSNTQSPVVIIFGPTAVGKTHVIDILTHLAIEIINADSKQVYKYMDVGTAKPPPKVLKRIPYHLIDIVEPSYQFNAGDFVKKAEALIPEIYKRQRLPVICGGTAFYIKNFVYGLPESPKGDPRIRKQLKNEYLHRGKAELFKELQSVDPLSAQNIEPNDSYRIIRALEVFRSSGRALSSYTVPHTLRQDYKILLIGLQRKREKLYERIEKRVAWMFEHGLLKEIKILLKKGYHEHDPGLRGIGYREFFEMQRNCTTLHDVKEKIKQNSKHYAKRQITFFKSLPGVQWIYADDIDRIKECMNNFLNSL